MNDERKELERQVSLWLEIAQEDYRLAKHAFTLSSPIPFRLIGYHAQQSAEKYLKAYLVSQLIDFPYTHSIEFLINLCEEMTGIRIEVPDAYELSFYAIAKRYPGDYKNITLEDAQRAISIATHIRDYIVMTLRQRGFTIENF